MSKRTIVEKSRLHFYEKVIKVKADVAALHIFFSDIDDAASGGVESCQGRRFSTTSLIDGSQLWRARIQELRVTWGEELEKLQAIFIQVGLS